ncbi:hypothetical protein SCUP234_01141 [Seiridium cupressi]
MDLIDMSSEGKQSAVTSRQLKRVGRGLRPATAKGLKHNFDDLPYTNWPGYWKQCRYSQHRLNAHVNHNNRQRKATQRSRAWVNDSEDGAELARSRIWLPSDACRQKPRLERQEAFRVPEIVYKSDVVEDDADLYRLGLLYDDDHARGSGFNLNAIVHPDLVYEVRPAKRTRRSTNYTECNRSEYDEDGSLILGQLLASVLEARSTGTDDAPQRHYPTPASTPLHVIHELADDMAHSLATPATADILIDCSDSEGEEDCIRDWDLIPVLRRAGSDLSTVLDNAENEAGIVAEAWVVLGET